MNSRNFRAILAALLLLGACAHYVPNAKLSTADPRVGYRFSRMPSGDAQDETFVILTLSGGGTRAAALAYGTMAKLAATPIRGRRTLLDEVDVISSVSGGSFTAMAYALEHRFPMQDFERSFLYRDVQRDLFRAAFLSPRNWFRLLSPRFSRIDVATEYYDRNVFGGHSYADLAASPRRPMVVINASEMDLGARFEFTQEQFDPICTDLQQMKVARAIAASSAFPGLLSPITLKNYAGKCGYVEPGWVADALTDRKLFPVRYRSAADVRAYLDPGRRFLHLMDGGVADNVGLRGPLRSMLATDPELSVLRLVDLGRVKRIVVIVVNARTESDLRLDRKERTPSIVSVLAAVAGAPMSNYSADTIELLRTTVSEWERDAQMVDDCQNLLRDACPDASLPDDDLARVTLYEVDIAFNRLPEDEKKRFDRIGTTFTLSQKDVDDLIAVAGRLLDESEDFMRLVRDLQ